MTEESTPCPRCEGTGIYASFPGTDRPCAVCDGTGRLDENGDPMNAKTTEKNIRSIAAAQPAITIIREMDQPLRVRAIIAIMDTFCQECGREVENGDMCQCRDGTEVNS